MKAILITAALAAAVPVAAEDNLVAGFVNNAGGMTIVTTRTHYCGRRGMFDGYAFSKDGASMRMCWISKGDMILAQFEDGDVYRYPPQIFEPLEVEPEVNFNQP